MPRICQLDSSGFFVGLVEADVSPVEPHELLIPAGAIDAPPPVLTPIHRARWTGTAWELIPAQDAEIVSAAVDGAGELTVEARIRAYTDVIQARLDAFAVTRGYNSMQAACSYGTSTVPRFRAEGEYCIALRDQTWTQCYAILDAVQAGERSVPSLDELLAELPVPQWPAAPALIAGAD